MSQIKTRYGIINGVETAEYYEDGKIKSAITSEYSQLETDYGKLIPAYELSDIRKKYRHTVEFYESGSLRSIYLEEQTEVETSLGKIKAELITFYENGNIKRIFPLYGQINGYWTEENEFELAKEMTIPILGDQIRPLYLIREQDIIHWMNYNNLTFIQCACRFTESCASCGGTEKGSKRAEIKELIRELSKKSPYIEKNIFQSVENVCLDTVIAYKKDGKTHRFLDEY